MNLSVSDPLVGQLLGERYLLLAHVARGGMATVYRATDQRLRREVAVKVMHSNLVNNEDDVARFAREARSAARLSHPGIVQVFDQGRDGPLVYLAMEFVRGRTLRDVIRESGPLPPTQALAIMDRILDALASAHTSQIVHRDVKPENVLMADDGRVKVADFGLARAIDAHTQHSRTGILFGTVSYLAPEQVERGHADTRSDVYAAGVVLFEMLTGTKPFTGDSPVQVALQHVSSRVPAPSSRRAGLEPGIDRLVARATARASQDRPATAGDLLRELRQTVQSSLHTAAAAAEQTIALPAVEHPTIALPAVALETTARHDLTTAASLSPVSPTEPGQPSRWRASWIAAATASAMVLVAGLTWYAFVGRMVTVPAVTGIDQVAATKSVTQANLRPQTSSVYDDRVPAGRVVSATPSSGQRVAKQSIVKLVISRGPETTKVPTLVGQSEQQAKEALSRARLSADPVERTYSDKPSGTVLSTKPAAASDLKVGSSVGLTVSRGPEPIPLASWVGQPGNKAQSAIDRSGLKTQTTSAFSETMPQGKVISQQPAAGTAPKGSVVQLVLSRGPELVSVPAVIGKPGSTARKLIEAQGLAVEERTVFVGRIRLVVAQNPPAGTMVRRGTIIQIAFP